MLLLFIYFISEIILINFFMNIHNLQSVLNEEQLFIWRIDESMWSMETLPRQLLNIHRWHWKPLVGFRDGSIKIFFPPSLEEKTTWRLWIVCAWSWPVPVGWWRPCFEPRSEDYTESSEDVSRAVLTTDSLVGNPRPLVLSLGYWITKKSIGHVMMYDSFEIVNERFTWL